MTNPNGPSLNDLMYDSYNQDGFVNVTTNVFTPQIGNVFGPGSGLSDNTAVTEVIMLNVPGLSSNWNVEDFTTTSEFVSVVIPILNHNFNLGVSDTTITSELVDQLRNGARNVSVSDTTVTSEVVIP